MNIIIISCGIFKNEIEYLIKNNRIEGKVTYLDSILHIYPEKLSQILENQIKHNINSKIVLVYGDCHAHMLDLEKNTNIVRTPGINCCEIIMGSPTYKKYRKEGAFFFMPEWCERWQDIFENHLGLKKENAAFFMKDLHSKLIYIDTGLQAVPLETLKDISHYVGLNIEVLKIDLSILAETINVSITKVRSNEK